MMIWANVVNFVRIDKFSPVNFRRFLTRAHQPVFDFCLHTFTQLL